MVTVTINGLKYSAAENETILTVAKRNKIKIPTLCFLKSFNETGKCRICLVEIDGLNNLQAACTLKIKEGMIIETESEKVIKARKIILELLISDHPLDCLTCSKIGSCKLQELCYKYEVNDKTITGERSKSVVDSSNQFYTLDTNKCILCGRCVSICANMQCNDAITTMNRGFKTSVGVDNNRLLKDSRCVSCGNCVSHCPVGALSKKSLNKYMEWETKKTLTTCTYCGVGCSLYLKAKDNEVVATEPYDGPSNNGMLCVKGTFGINFINHKDRLKKPLLKVNGKFEEISWEKALNLLTSKINFTKKTYGSDSIGGFASAKVTNEENYLFQKLFRGVIGTNNIDHCARLCHASTVSGLATTLGSGAMTNSIEEIEDTDVFFVIGSNTTESHPVIGAKIRQRLKKGAKLIVAEPRKIDLAENAHCFLQIKPGTNVALLNGMMNVIINENLHDKTFIENRTENFDELKCIVNKYTPEVVAHICQVPKEHIIKAARLYANGVGAIYYAMGITQHSTGTDGVMSVSNLALLCGNIGIKGGGVNPLRGQNNVQGCCDMGCLPTDFPGYQKVSNSEIIKKFEIAWNVKLSDSKGKTITEIINDAHSGNIKLLYIMGENPMISDPDINHVKESLENLDFLVVQDIFLTETAALADLILPATTFAEKDGTFTNTERRVQRVRKAIEPAGESRTDLSIIIELMNLLGYKANYKNASEVMDEIAMLTPIYGGISYERIEKRGLQWPCKTKDDSGTKFLHEKECIRGKGLFKPCEYIKSKELPDLEYPIILTTGRNLYHFHTNTMTGKTDGLINISPKSYLEINPKSAEELSISDGELIKVKSRRGEIFTTCKITKKIPHGIVFMPFHFADGAVNILTNNVVDPIAKIPELKVCAIRIEKV